jgi:glycosyltransferase involved in cell wall biosynthesis
VRSEPRLPISVCMIAGAEERRIRRALESVSGWVAEIVVVVNADINDATGQIAQSCGGRVFREPWKGHIAQKNSAAEKATQQWILGLDADEVVSPALREELQRLFAPPTGLEKFAAFRFPRLSWYCGRWIRHGDWYPDHQCRLWRRGQARWGGVDPHDRLEVSGRIGLLRSDLWHYSCESIDHQISKIPTYAAGFVNHRLSHGRGASWWDLCIRPVWRFIRAYVFRLGFLDGWPGYYIAWANAFATVTRYAKLREAQLRQERPR